MSQSPSVQIFGLKKCQNTRKAERFFKERRIHVHRVPLEEKSFSKGELDSILKAVGSGPEILNENSKLYSSLGFPYVQRDMVATLLEHSALIRTPVVRIKNNATIGFDQATWKKWIADGIL